ncbi:nitrogenase iron-molybdenum cofactor biosynthesis protein NifN [Gynuella sp.]|uniref:nitrogenase iron-molybdenum cofactor biosynthesis protein NifN n=1 Tax=Gynuella sp. TaxID=2969146 RepID=UPI003D0FAF7D
MSEIIKRKKALAVSPLKASQTVGASLAFLGLNRSMPLMHGSQGCTAFAKVFFVRHFREPIPLQTTAMDQTSTVMGADENIVQALATLCQKSAPAVIGLVTTGLAETQGCDIQAAVKTFAKEHPELAAATAVVPVNTPDFSGCFESGYALAVKAMINTLVPDTHDGHENRVGMRRRQVNVLCGAHLTPGDLEYLTDSIEQFGLRPLLIPDLSGSLDGHLSEDEFNPLTTGGTTVEDLASAGESIATLVIGASLFGAAERLEQKTAVPIYRFHHLMGITANDRWLVTLSELSGQPVPSRYQRYRSQLQDAMLDTHFMIGDKRVAIAADPDLLIAFEDFLRGMGAATVAAVVPAASRDLTQLPMAEVHVGDLEDLERLAAEQGAELLLGNSHAVDSAGRLGLPLLRIGFPQYDLLGGFQRCWSGYRGSQQALFDLANMIMASHHDIRAYTSIYRDSGNQYSNEQHMRH